MCSKKTVILCCLLTMVISSVVTLCVTYNLHTCTTEVVEETTVEGTTTKVEEITSVEETTSVESESVSVIEQFHDLEESLIQGEMYKKLYTRLRSTLRKEYPDIAKFEYTITSADDNYILCTIDHTNLTAMVPKDGEGRIDILNVSDGSFVPAPWLHESYVQRIESEIKDLDVEIVKVQLADTITVLLSNQERLEIELE